MERDSIATAPESKGGEGNGQTEAPGGGLRSPARGRLNPSKEAPFAWQSKSALRAIATGRYVTNPTHCIAVYVALTAMESRPGEAFACMKGVLAAFTGLSTRSVRQAALDLERLRLVQITRTKVPGTRENAVNAYLLLTRSRQQGKPGGRAGDARPGATGTQGRVPESGPAVPGIRNTPFETPEGSSKGGENEAVAPPAAGAASAGAAAPLPANGDGKAAWLTNGLPD